MPSIRMQKVNALFKREIGQIIQRELGNPNLGFATVTHTEISNDLQHAVVRVSVLGTEAQRTASLDALNSAAGYIQHLLSQRVKIRTMPRLRFMLDRSLDAVSRIENVLGQLAEEQASSAEEGAASPTEDDEPEEGGADS